MDPSNPRPLDKRKGREGDRQNPRPLDKRKGGGRQKSRSLDKKKGGGVGYLKHAD